MPALADANLLGAYRPAHRLSDTQRQVRGRLGVREALVRTRTRYIALIRAHKTEAVYRRYAIVAESDLRDAGTKLAATLGTAATKTSLSDNSGDNSVTVRKGRSLNA